MAKPKRQHIINLKISHHTIRTLNLCSSHRHIYCFNLTCHFPSTGRMMRPTIIIKRPIGRNPELHNADFPQHSKNRLA
jgi:hypothetical protein